MREPDDESLHPPVPAVETPAVEAPGSDEPDEPDEPPPPGPAYDLEADMAEREAVARRTLGRNLRITRVEGVFLVVGASMDKRDFNRALHVFRKTLVAYRNERFATLPERAVDVYLFATRRPYQAYCDKYYDGCGTPFGVYYREDRRIVMNIGPGVGTLTHELVHPIMETDFPQAPEWINEGIASLFERPRYPAEGEIKGVTNWRLPRLQDALASGDERELVSLERMITMSDRVFRGRDEDLHYSMARYACQWLDEQKLLWPFYQAWRDNAAQDATGEKAFLEIVGKTPAEANADWLRWVGEQRLRR